MRRIVLSILLCAVFYSGISQNWATMSWDDYTSLMESVSKKYEAEEYTLELVYKTYKGRQLQTPFEISSSYVQRSKTYDYSYLKGIVTIQNESLKITIDSNNQMIALNSGVPRVSQKDMLDQYSSSKELIKDIKQKEEKGSKVLEINYKQGSPIEKVQLSISRNQEIKDIIVFYTNKVDYEDDDGNEKSDYVVLQIEYQSFVPNKHLHKELSLNEVIVNKNNSPGLSDGFKDFELVDLRLKN